MYTLQLHLMSAPYSFTYVTSFAQLWIMAHAAWAKGMPA